MSHPPISETFDSIVAHTRTMTTRDAIAHAERFATREAARAAIQHDAAPHDQEARDRAMVAAGVASAMALAGRIVEAHEQ